MNDVVQVPEEVLRARAEFLGVDEEEYLNATPRQRNMQKAQFVRKLKKSARERGEDPDSYAKNCMEEWPRGPDTAALEEKKRSQEKLQPKAREVPETVEQNGQELTLITPEKMAEIQRRARRAVDGDFEKPKMEPPYVENEDGTKVYTTGDGEVPPAEEDPLKRDGITVGSIREIEKPPAEDLVGDRPPRTITDLFARWPIADDPSYSIRIERTKPKRHGGVDVAGFVGEIRGRAVTEADIQRWFGGTEYLLTVYGPDPRGKTDLNDMPIIKPLTEPIKLIVPVLPPNTQAIPALNQGTDMQNNQTPNPMNPFGPVAPQMTNQHDAAMHRTNVDFNKSLLQWQREDQRTQEKQDAAANASMFSAMMMMQKEQSETQREEIRAREKEAERRLEAEREERRKAEEKMEKLEEAIRERTGQSNFDVESMTKLLTTVGPNREAESQRQAEYYRMQMETMKQSHEESLRQLRDRHDAEMRRADDRLKDNEAFYKRIVEDERSKAADREKHLREEVEKIRREEREMADKRIADIKERHESEMRQAEKSHERELRALKDSWDTKSTVTDKTWEMQLSQVQERLIDAKEEADRAREEAKENSDPAKVLEKAKAQAEVLGYEKKDDAPKNAWERFAATAGAGLSQALSNINEWGPAAMAAARGGAVPPGMTQVPQLPPQMRQQVRGAPQQPQPRPRPQQPNPAQQPPVARRKSRAASWATEKVGPLHQQPIEVPEAPLGFENPEAPQEQPLQTPETAPATEEQNQQMAPNPQAETSDIEFPQLPEKFTQHFQPEAIFGFLGQIEQAINGLYDPSVVADQFYGQFPEAATTLVNNFTDSEVVEAVKAIPGAEASPIVRRDGQQFLESLWRDLKKKLPESAQST
jgi:hypothetical protein